MEEREESVTYWSNYRCDECEVVDARHIHVPTDKLSPNGRTPIYKITCEECSHTYEAWNDLY